jgi:hypothetical protein
MPSKRSGKSWARSKVPIDYISNLSQVPELCDHFEQTVRKNLFDDGRRNQSKMANFSWTPLYQEWLKPIKSALKAYQLLRLDYLGDQEHTALEAAFRLEEPSWVFTLTDFSRSVYLIRVPFLMTKEMFRSFSACFDEQERARINEAIHTLGEDCYFSSVVMSVSAVEARLLALMCHASPEAKPRLERLTLGRLTFHYSAKKGQFKSVVPEKHEPLLSLCNTYRVFSAHPKKQNVTRAVASSILKLGVDFLIDPDTMLVSKPVSPSTQPKPPGSP